MEMEVCRRPVSSGLCSTKLGQATGGQACATAGTAPHSPDDPQVGFDLATGAEVIVRVPREIEAWWFSIAAGEPCIS
jgi:hypothetical protein